MRLGQATVTYDSEAEPCEELPWEHITGDAGVAPSTCGMPSPEKHALHAAA